MVLPQKKEEIVLEADIISVIC